MVQKIVKRMLRIIGLAMILVAVGVPVYSNLARLVNNDDKLTIAESWLILEFADKINNDRSSHKFPSRTLSCGIVVPARGRAWLALNNSVCFFLWGLLTLGVSGLHYGKSGITIFPQPISRK